jgi:hypothetical protein
VFLLVVKSYFVQYKFILPDSIKHSSYEYQKLFRAIYGYTQKVSKSGKREYSYVRKGILSDLPYISAGKNCVIIPSEAFQPLQEFFKTGKNPAHLWDHKGEWKCTYFLNEKDISIADTVKAIEQTLERKLINTNQGPVSLSEFIKNKARYDLTKNKDIFLSEIKRIVECSWFKETYQQNQFLSEVNAVYRQIRDNVQGIQQAPQQQVSQQQVSQQISQQSMIQQQSTQSQAIPQQTNPFQSNSPQAITQSNTSQNTVQQ